MSKYYYQIFENCCLYSREDILNKKVDYTINSVPESLWWIVVYFDINNISGNTITTDCFDIVMPNNIISYFKRLSLRKADFVMKRYYYHVKQHFDIILHNVPKGETRFTWFFLLYDIKNYLDFFVNSYSYSLQHVEYKSIKRGLEKGRNALIKYLEYVG